jgi:hypothetical protein
MARQEGRASPVDRLAVVAVVLLCPAAAQLLHLGQVTLFIGAATFAAFWFIAYRRRPALAGVFLAIACLKPTVPIFLVVWLLLEREALCLAVAAAITLLFTAYPLAMFGPIDLVQNWLDAAHRYAAAEFNVAESVEVVGLNPLLAALGIAAVPEVVVGVGLTALLWATRDRFTRLEQLGLLCGLTVLFSRLHNYDLIVVLPLLIAVLMRAPWTAASSVFGVAMVVLFYLPQRPLLMLCDAPVIGQWRMILIVVAGLWIAADPVGKRSRAPPLSAAP